MKGPGPLLYRPPPRWQNILAFGGAVAIHCAAVAIAAIKPQEEIMDLTDIPEAVVELSIETQADPAPPPLPRNISPPPPRRRRFPGTARVRRGKSHPSPSERLRTAHRTVSEAKTGMTVRAGSMSSVQGLRHHAPRRISLRARVPNNRSGVCVMTVDSASARSLARPWPRHGNHFG